MYVLAVNLVAHTATSHFNLDNQTVCQSDGNSKPLVSYGLAAQGGQRRGAHCALPGLRNPSFEHSLT